jgi:CubicO group peptidase (beta-lactamase class C family)
MRVSSILSVALVAGLVGCGAELDSEQMSGRGRADADEVNGSNARSDEANEAAADPKNKERWNSLLAFARTAIAADRTPGAGIAIVLDGKLAFRGGVGVKSLRGRQPVSGETLFRVGSMSKMITAAALLALVDRGQLRLSDRATTHVPDFHLRPPSDPSSITVEQLLFHTAALPDEFDWTCPTGSGALRRWFQTHTDYPLWAPPGTFFNYSNVGYSLAGLVGEMAGRLPYAELVEQMVFEPGGMRGATFDVSAAAALDHSELHALQDPVTGETGDAPVEHGITEFDCAYGAPAGNVIASPADFAHFAETLFAGGGTMLKPESAAAMLRGHVPALGMTDPVTFGQDGAYGFGLVEHRDYKGEIVVEHGGGYLGAFSAFWMVPGRRFAAVCLSNGEGDPTAYCSKAVDLFLDLPDVAPAVSLPDAARLDLFAGTYDDPNGNLGTVTVTSDGKDLFVQIPDWEIEGAALAIGGSQFSLSEASGLSFAFFPTDARRARFLVSRAGVAVRR